MSEEVERRESFVRVSSWWDQSLKNLSLVAGICSICGKRDALAKQHFSDWAQLKGIKKIRLCGQYIFRRIFVARRPYFGCLANSTRWIWIDADSLVDPWIKEKVRVIPLIRWFDDKTIYFTLRFISTENRKPDHVLLQALYCTIRWRKKKYNRIITNYRRKKNYTILRKKNIIKYFTVL